MNDQRPRVSVVITTHNRPHLLHRAVRSAVAQTLPSWEIIVVDDGSTEPVGDLPNYVVRVIRRAEAGGVCVARNAGLAAATGDWITFLDDDDEVTPEFLDRSMEAVDRSMLLRPVAALSGIRVVSDDGSQSGVRLPPSLARGADWFLEEGVEGHFLTQNTLVAPTEVIRAIGGWNEQLQAWEHDDFFFRLNASCSLQGIPELLYTMHDHPGARAHKKDLECALAMEATLSLHRGKFLPRPKRHAHYLGTMGVYFLRGNRWGRAIGAIFAAVLRNPRDRRLWTWLLVALTGPRGLKMAHRLRTRLSDIRGMGDASRTYAMTPWTASALRRGRRLLTRSRLERFPFIAAAASSVRTRFVATTAGLDTVLIENDGLLMEVPYESMAVHLDGTYELETTAYIANHLRPGMVVVDVGAHVGHFTLRMARAVSPGGRVYAFEPHSANADALESNLLRNGLSNTTIIRKACGDRQADVRLHLSRWTGVHSVVAEPGGHLGSVDVPMVRLDDVVRDDNVDLVKVDVEGADLDVLKGMKGILDRSPRVTLVVEWNPQALRAAGRSPTDLPQYLRRLGYRLRLADAQGQSDVDHVVELLTSEGALDDGWYGNIIATRVQK